MVAVWSWYSFWMILHVLTAIVAFGPALALPLLGRYAQTHPAAAATIADLGHLVEQRLVAPVSLLVGLTGVALIFAVPPWRDGPIDLWGTPWLVASVVWFVAALVFSALFQSPNSARFARAVAAGAGTPATGGFAEPPREVATLSKRLQVGGALLTISTIGILVLMVWQPGA